ncbi:MAG: SGNH/GDSL hydrolase family protein [Candidatus Omnitrophica bacterium]|nr:SGNH/GDSL hydrolase family protein [Candidatus Omnitrophota bacterium]
MRLSEGSKNGIILLSVSLFFFTTLELIARSDTPSNSLGYVPSSNDRIVYELRPDYKLKSIKSEISSQKLNDMYFPLKKSPGVYRIACIGDSVSFGYKVKREESFPKVLEKMLNEDNKGKYEVINFSVPGYNTAQESEILKEKVLGFDPDAVILVYCGNDTHLCNLIKPEVTPLNFLYVHSHYVHKILRNLDVKLKKSKGRNSFENSKWLWFKKNILGMFYHHITIYNQPGLELTTTYGDPSSSPELVPERYHYMLGFDNYRLHLSNIKDTLKRHNIKLISCGFFNPRTLAINKEIGIERALDLNNVFPDESVFKSDFTIGNGDNHLNVKGHTLVAQYLYEKVWGTE